MAGGRVMKIAILGASGHWSLVKDALAAKAPETAGCEFHTAPGLAGEDVTPVLTSVASLGGAIRGHADWRALLDSVKPDLAVVNPPFHLIGAITRECLARGINVLAEKPIATEWEDLNAIRALATAKDLGASRSAPRLMSTFTMRYAPEFLAGYRFVAQGGIGKPSLINVQKSYPLESWDGGARPAFYRKRATFGGVIPWIGMHAIDLIRWFGGAEFATVSAAHTLVGNQGHEELEASATMHFRLTSGTLGSAQVDFLRRRVAKAGGGTDDPWGDDRLRAAGDGGMLEIRGGRAWAVTRDGRPIEIPPVEAPALLPAFIRWTQGGEPMLLSTEDCLAAADATLKARDSADRGAVIAF
jgi:predicted dehydrogenase